MQINIFLLVHHRLTLSHEKSKCSSLIITLIRNSLSCIFLRYFVAGLRRISVESWGGGYLFSGAVQTSQVNWTRLGRRVSWTPAHLQYESSSMVSCGCSIFNTDSDPKSHNFRLRYNSLACCISLAHWPYHLC
jgi:hypothetical protein